MTDAEKIECMDIIEKLNAEEGHSVEIVNINPEGTGPDNRAVLVSTDYSQTYRTHFGHTLLDALKDALTEGLT